MLDRDREQRYWDCLDQARQASSGGRGEEALNWLDEAIRLNPQGAEARNNRGEVLWDQGRADESLAEFSRAVELAPECYFAHLNRLEILVEEFGECEHVLELADELLRRDLERSTQAEIFYLKAKALFYLDDLDGALFLLRRAMRSQGDEAGFYRGFEGQILFEMGRLAEAQESLQLSLRLEPDVAHTLYHLALIAEHRSEYEKAEDLFKQAERVHPDVYPRPVRISEDAFQEAAEQAVRDLPANVRGYIEHCPILIEDLPEANVYEAQDISPTVLGLFVGTPITEPGFHPGIGTAPRLDVDRIILYKRNLERVVSSRKELVEQIQITVKHELGHYLGLDEDEVERLGLA
jgi:predicted Zn-dependent protease with MMP-like domain/Flp pilus assembly protein TadD